MKVPLASAILCLGGVLLAGALPATETEPCHHEAIPVHSEERALDLPDTVLVDQDGREVRFADLVAGRRVAVSFIFTTCTTICPPIGANFARLQRELAPRSASGVRLLSISVDPRADTPERLKAWRGEVGGGEGWILLTGPKARVDGLLKALGVYSANPREHSPVILLGDARTGRWQRLYGLTPPAELADLLLEVPR